MKVIRGGPDVRMDFVGAAPHRYVTDLIFSRDSTENGHFLDYHRFLSQAC